MVLNYDGAFSDHKGFLFQDGWCIARLKETGLPILVVSTAENPLVKARCEKLGIACLQGGGEKWPALKAWLAEQGIMPDGIVYVAKDLSGLLRLLKVGCGMGVADAHPKLCAAAHLVLKTPAGAGVVREVVDLILHRLED